MPEKSGWRKWVWEQRNSRRIAWLLQMGSRVLTSLTNLFWIRLLVGAMGLPLNSLYLAAQSFFGFGGVGDFGMGGAVSLRAGEALGQGKARELRDFLAAARGVFLLLAILCGGGMLLFSHWLPHWFKFEETATSGPLPRLFAIGGILMAATLLYGYIGSLNYACGNVAWPILPDLFLLQLALLSHWLLARQNQPLWLQFAPYCLMGLIRLFLSWYFVRQTHPEFAELWPVRFDWTLTLTLFESSFWIYLCTIGNLLYRNTDNMVINASQTFAKGTVSAYSYNYKFCDIAVFVVLTASLVSLPKITQLMASPAVKDQDQVKREMRKLNQFQTLLGCGAALAYLWGNNLFMKIWWAHDKNPILPAALGLQLAFALNLAVTTCGDAGIQLALRSGKTGLRRIGIVIGLTGLLNLGLSILAMKLHSLWGIAFATVIAQSVLSLAAGFYICRHLKLNWLPWLSKGWLVPIAAISLAGWLRMVWPLDTTPHIIYLTTAYLALMMVIALALGVNAALLKEEFTVLKKILPR